MERIPLNDDSLWHGLAMDCNNPMYKKKLPEIHRLILEGKMHDAEELIAQYMAGVPYSQRLYTFIGQLNMALFYEDFLMEVDGQLLTCPSVSPENRCYLPDGSDTPLCVSPAMDNQLLREFFEACIEI